MSLKIVCNETGCDSQFSKIEYLCDHLISVHKQIHQPEQVIEFESESKLEAFKASTIFYESSMPHFSKASSLH